MSHPVNNRAMRTLIHLRSGGTALTVLKALGTTTPSKAISDARKLAKALRYRWEESWIKLDTGRSVKLYRVRGRMA